MPTSNQGNNMANAIKQQVKELLNDVRAAISKPEDLQAAEPHLRLLYEVMKEVRKPDAKIEVLYRDNPAQAGTIRDQNETINKLRNEAASLKIRLARPVHQQYDRVEPHRLRDILLDLTEHFFLSLTNICTQTTHLTEEQQRATRKEIAEEVLDCGLGYVAWAIQALARLEGNDVDYDDVVSRIMRPVCCYLKTYAPRWMGAKEEKARKVFNRMKP